jgi:predicted RNA-binding protein YlxR (DUF448 family)
MAKQKQPRRAKHVPQRTCVACKEVQAKGALVRVVRTPEGVFPDPQGKKAGRGAYLHARAACWKPGIEKHLPAALRTALTAEDKQRLTDYFSGLPEEPAETAG